MSDSERTVAGLPDNLPKPPEQPVQKVQLPAELQGKSPEEIYTALSVAHQQEIANAVNEVKAQFVDRPREGPGAGGQQAAPQGAQYGPYAPGYAQQSRQPEEPDLFTNSEAFMESQFNKRIAPLVQATVTSHRETNRQVFETRNKEVYDKYNKEIEQIVDGFAPQVQMHPNAYVVASNYVRSLHLDDEINSASQKKTDERLLAVLEKIGIDPKVAKDAILNNPEGGQQSRPPMSLFQPTTGVPGVERSTQPMVGSTGKGTSRPRLTPEQEEVAKRFDMTPEEYLQYYEMNTDIISEIERRTRR